MAGKGGGAWKVAYADFVTAMMAFFLVMWIVAQNKPVKEAIAGYFRDPKAAEEGAFGKGRPGKGGDGGGFNKLAADDDDEGGGRRAALMVLSDTNDRHTGSMIRFPHGSAELTDESKERLKELAALLAGKLNKVEVRGHAARPASDDAKDIDPWQLSYARSSAVMKGLIELGIDQQRLRLSQAGAYEPLSTDADDAALAEDARVEVYALNEFADQYAHGKKKRGKRAPVTAPAEEKSEY